MADSFNAFIQKWITPMTVLSLFGAIAWGLQHNFLLMEHNALLIVHEREIDELKANDATVSISLAEGIVVQRQLAKALTRMEKEVAGHNIEAEQWKRKILLNEQELKRNSKGGTD